MSTLIQDDSDKRTSTLTQQTVFDMPSIQTKEDVIDYLAQQQIKHVKVAVTDLNGVLRGKYMSVSKFIGALETGFGFCDVIVGTDIDDQLCEGMEFTGWHSGYPDATLEVIPSSCRRIPYEKNSVMFLCQFAASHNQLCPRSVLQKVIDRATDMGFKPLCALEFEFSLFANNLSQCYQDNFADLQPLTPANCGYSILRSSTHSEFYHDLLHFCEQMHMPLEGLHTEIGPGVLEAAIAYDQAMLAADKAALFKTFTKVFAQRRDIMATFMAKWDKQQQGQSGHTHISLQDLAGKPIFYAADAQHGMSKQMRHFLAGQQQLMPELLAMVAPTVNSFARLVPGYWAPTQASWGVDNRTCALRVIGGKPTAQRIEYRVPGADVNPYFAIAVALASGLYGIEHQLELTDPIEGNAYEFNLPASLQLPRSLGEAATRLRGSKMAQEYFGSDFVADYATTRENEQREANKQITDWQLKRYFELA